jgi:esterase/lipase superfamily enzyme
VLSYGRVEVTIPATHRAGRVERPSVWRLEFAPDPARHVTLRSARSLEAGPFWEALRSRASDPARAPEAFVFVHGYNTGFDQAARRTAQLAWDTGFAGVPILYSWPSRDRLSGYIADTAAVRLSGRRLGAFLEDLVARSGAETIHVVAHSMGNRALTDALELMAARRPGLSEPVIDQAIFAAPDVDAGLFAEMARSIRPLVRRMTLYGSEADWALLASRKLHGGAPRAGDGGAAALALAEVDTIDMSTLGEDVLAHGYAVNDRSAMMDLATLFWRDLPPEARCGVTPGARAGAVTVWDYRPEACDAPTLIGLIAALDRAGVEDARALAPALSDLLGDAPVGAELMPVLREMLER